MADKNVITTRTVEFRGAFHGPGFPLTLSEDEYRGLKGRGEVVDAPKKKEKEKAAPPSPPVPPPVVAGQGDGAKTDGDPPPDPSDPPPS